MDDIWFKNLIGISVSEEELKKIPNLRTELFLHICLRSVQATSILSAAFCAPLVTFVRGILIAIIHNLFVGPRNFTSLMQRCRKYAVFGMFPGVCLGPVLMHFRMRHQPEEGYYDRCYRLRCNQRQVRIDRFTYLGLIGGSVIGLSGSLRLFEMITLGLWVGTFSAIGYNSIKDVVEKI